jgi:hypothetical protein
MSQVAWCTPFLSVSQINNTSFYLFGKGTARQVPIPIMEPKQAALIPQCIPSKRHLSFNANENQKSLPLERYQASVALIHYFQRMSLISDGPTSTANALF